MAQCKVTAQEFIQNTFSPIISVACSPLVEIACQKNNLSFVELLQPFCRLNIEGQLRDPSGNVVTIKNLRIHLINLYSQPPQPNVARRYLNSSVSLTTDVRMSSVSTNTNEYKLEIPSTLPWFDMWRETFLDIQYPSDHEFTKHLLACIIVVSSSETNPLECVNSILQNITELQTSNQKYPKWFCTNILRYFIVVHDTIDGNEENAIKTMEHLKQTYGINNCYLLQMNSRPPGFHPDEHFLPDPWSQFLIRKTNNYDTNDCDKLRKFSDNSLLSRSVQSLEVGLEANEMTTNISSPVTFHPLSPDVDNQNITNPNEDDVDDDDVVATNADVSLSPVVHGACLTTTDIEQLKQLVHEFYLKSLLPCVEKQIQRLTDAISNKKGVSRSLFSATKRWFTPNKMGSTAAVNSVVYADDSSELQLRKLGDLYFMFGHYNMAFQVYHSAKRDFNADQAWLYYAGALEMAALSAFMCGEMTRKAYDYMEESIVTYLYTCRMAQFATRVTLLSTECLKEKGQYGEAAHQFIRMTSEDSDLRSALLLEQAAYCFLHCQKPRMIRKYAFHIILAGHRFSKCSQRKHSLRCYRQAFQVYHNKGWSLAEDHIYFTIGRQASNLKQLNEAKDAFSKLLTPYSKQNSQQQAVFLREYLNIQYHMTKELYDQQLMHELPILPMPILNSNETKVLVGPQVPFSIPGRVAASGVSFTSDDNADMNEKWLKLEQMMVQGASSGTQQMLFKPIITLFSKHNSVNVKPIAIQGEPIQVQIQLKNTLQILLPMKNLYLLWRFTETDTSTTVQNETDDDQLTKRFINTECIECYNIGAGCEEKIILVLTPLTMGELQITGICYTIISDNGQDSGIGITGKQDFHIHGPKLINVKEKDNQNIYAPDKRLSITIAQPAPCLQVGFSEINQELLCNELQKITIEFRNCGTSSLHKIMMSSSVPHLFSIASNDYYKDDNINSSNVFKIKLPPNYNNRLEPGQSHVINIWLRAPDKKGIALVNLLFYYENMNPVCVPRYRLVKHLWHFSVQDSLETEMNIRHSCDYNNIEMVTISLRATNSNHIHHAAAVSEITLHKAVLISRDWEFVQQYYTPSDMKLQCQESIHFLIKAQRILNRKKSSNRSELKFTDDIANVSDHFSNMNEAESMLILGWHAFVTDSAGNKRSVVGQHSILIKNMVSNYYCSSDNDNNLFHFERDEQYQNDYQIIYSVAHEPIIVHDFNNHHFCIIPMKFILYSRAGEDFIVKVKTRPSGNKIKNELFHPNGSNCFRWIGHSEFVQYLKPFSSCEIQLSIAVICPGTYDLGEHIEVSCKKLNNNNNSNFILQSCRIQNALIVKNIHDL